VRIVEEILNFFAIEVLCDQAHHIRGEGSVTKKLLLQLFC
jgi:hypothetical protein